MNSFGPTPPMSQQPPQGGGWPQPPNTSNINGNIPQPNIIPQMANMNLSGPNMYEPAKQNQFSNYSNTRPMQQNGPPPLSNPSMNNNFNQVNNNVSNNMNPLRQQTQQNGPSPVNQYVNRPPPAQQFQPAVLPINSETIENSQLNPNVTSQLNQERPPSQVGGFQQQNMLSNIAPPSSSPIQNQTNNGNALPQSNFSNVNLLSGPPPPTSSPAPQVSSGQNFGNIPSIPPFTGQQRSNTPSHTGPPTVSNSIPGPPAMQASLNSESVGAGHLHSGAHNCPPVSKSGFPPTAGIGHPPTGTGFPPTSTVGFPPTTGVGLPPTSGAGLPQSTGTGFLPSSATAFQPTTGTGFPPTSGTGFPPTTGTGFPPNSNTGFPPKSGTGFPPTSNAGFPPGFPPTSEFSTPVSKGLSPTSQMSAGPGVLFNTAQLVTNTSGNMFPPTSNQPLAAQKVPMGVAPAARPIPATGPMPPAQGQPSLYSGHSTGMQLNQSTPQAGFPSQQQGFPPVPLVGNLPPQQKQPGFPSSQQQPGFPPQQQQPGFAPQQQQPGFPQPQQQPGFPPQSQPGFPPQQPGFPPQQPGFPPMPSAQQPNYGAQSGLPPYGNQPGMQQQSGMPPHMPPQQPGGPNRPQQPGMYNQTGGGYPNTMGLPAAPQQRRLDPDQMPNPIEVMNENDNSFSGPFITNQPGLVPPLVTTEYVTQDQGNSGPRFIRSSMYNVPATQDMMKQAAVPFSLIISPFAKTVAGELTPPIVDFGELGPIRCIRCKAYISPTMQFIDGGRRFRCLLCEATTEVPAEYFQHLDHTGQRVDKFERPELVLGTYEFVATKDYCQNNVPPKPPALIFVIDVSYNNIKSGLVHLLCAEMKRIIKNLPIDQNCDRSFMKVGFITYNNTVHFYNIKNSLAQPQMMVVGDVQEMFMPLLDGFLCDPDESSFVIDSLMEQIPKMFGDSRETETILLPAIQAGLEALKASECSGKLLVFNSSLPIAEAPGKLKNRDDRKLLGTEKEKTVLVPQCTTYNNLGQDCVSAGCSVDLFLFNNSYIDVATIGQVARLTGGEVYKYTYFQADIDGKRLVNDIIKNISRPIAFDAVMRVRTSTGIRPTDFYGHFFMSNTTDVQLASIDSEKSIALEIKHDDKLKPEDNVFIQVALLYTSCSGQRRLRILNLCLKICIQMADMFRSCDLDTIMLYLAKQSIFKLMDSTPKAIKDTLVTRCAQILACYRRNCATPTSAGQLILPECMKLLPLYTSCLLKNDAMSGGSDMTVDDRSYVMQYVLTMALPSSVKFLYPRLVSLHDVEPEESELLPAQIRCSGEKMLENGAYILENGIHMFIWLGVALAPEFCQSVFGVQHATQIDTDRVELPVFDNPLSRKVREIVNVYQQESARCMRVTFVRQRDKLEGVFKHFLVEDRGTDGSPSYVDFLCHMHKEIRQLLS